ncbi:MAG: hypothetical protein AAF614_35105 [Chloroflexota bacterium]
MIHDDLVQQIPAHLQASLHKKRLIFTIATCPKQTDNLTRILSVVPNVVCHHAAHPSFASMRQQLLQNEGCTYDFWLRRKLPRIADCTSAIYIDTSHLFGKGFAESLVELGVVPDLIVLTSPIRETAVQLYQSGTIPGRTAADSINLLTPDDDDVMPLFGWQHLHDYQLCYWYCLEMARRGQKYAKLCRSLGGRVVTTTLAELETLTGLRQFVMDLELPWLTLQDWLRFAWLNQQKSRPFQIPEPLLMQVDQLEQEVMDRLVPMTF